MKRQGIESLEQGDIVMLYTGWLKLIGQDNERFAAGNPGLLCRRTMIGSPGEPSFLSVYWHHGES